MEPSFVMEGCNAPNSLARKSSGVGGYLFVPTRGLLVIGTLYTKNDYFDQTIFEKPWRLCVFYADTCG
jgi:hypothetical protein